MSKEKAIIIFTVAIDVIGLGIIIPVLPVYVESFGLSAFTVTMMLSVFSLFSFLSAPFLGVLSDKIGRRPVLLISIASTSLGWFVFAAAKSLGVLMLGRTIDGMAAGNFSTAQSFLSDISKDEKDRAANLGLIGMIFGLGFIVGPFIGGLLSKVSPSFPFYFVGAMALLNVILAFFFLPETNKHMDPDKKIGWNPLKPLIAAAKNKKLRTLYLVGLLYSIISVIGNSVFALYLTNAFGFNSFTAGLFFTVVGIVLAVNQGFLLRRFWLEKFKQKQLILIMMGFFAVGFLMMSLKILALFIIGMILTAFGQSTAGVAITNEIVGEADVKERGETVGVLSGISSVSAIIGPIISGAAFELHYGLSFVLAAILSILTGVIMYSVHVKDIRNKEIESLAREVT